MRRTNPCQIYMACVRAIGLISLCIKQSDTNKNQEPRPRKQNIQGKIQATGTHGGGDPAGGDEDPDDDHEEEEEDGGRHR